MTGARGILDVGTVPPDRRRVSARTSRSPSSCGFRSSADEQDAGLGYDLWLINRGAASTPPMRVQTQARQGEDATVSSFRRSS